MKFSLATHPDGAALWEAIRKLKDVDLDRIEQTILQHYSIKVNEEADKSNTTIVLPLDVDRNASKSNQREQPHEWKPHEFVEVFLDYIRDIVHEQERSENNSEKGRKQKEQEFALTNPEEFPALGAAKLTNPEEFPELGAVGQMVRKKHVSTLSVQAKPMTKRRITTTVLSAPTATSSSTVPPSTASAFAVPEIASSEVNAWSKREKLLERRMLVPHEERSTNVSTNRSAATLKTSSNLHTPRKAKASVSTTQQESHMSPPPTRHKTEHTPPICMSGKQKKRAKRALIVNPIEDPSHLAIPLFPSVSPNLNAARLYGFLIANRVVISTCRELKLLLSLFFRSTCQSCPSVMKEFCHASVSTTFAIQALCAAKSFLLYLHMDVLVLITKTIEESTDTEQAIDLLSDLRESIQARETQRVLESTRIGYKVPIETSSSPIDYVIPFHQVMDARIYYKTSTEVALYVNRERVRDMFLHQLRTFQRYQHSFSSNMVQPMKESNFIHDVQTLLREVLLPINRWWFAHFFVLELIQIGSNPICESDHDVVELIKETQPEERLRKLHRRFSTPTTELKGKESKGNHKNDCSIEDTMRKTWMSENQQFFAFFLQHCDSFFFSQNVQRHCLEQFYLIWNNLLMSHDIRRECTEKIFQLMVLATFLGFLQFSPQWSISTFYTNHSSNIAIQTAYTHAIKTMNHTKECLVLDIETLLIQSIENGTLSLCIPWLNRFLIMMQMDSWSLSTRFYQKICFLLHAIRQSPRLNHLQETGVYLSLQLDQILSILGSDSIPRLDEMTSIDHSILIHLTQPVTSSAIDNLPFLYTTRLIHVCLSELDDLYGFLQTRATNLVSNHTSTTSLRKVRPLHIHKEKEIATTTHLENAVWKQYPLMKRAKDMVLEMVVMTTCDTILAQMLPLHAQTLVNQAQDIVQATSSEHIQQLETQVDEQLREWELNTVRNQVLKCAHEQCATQIASALPPLLHITQPTPSTLVLSAVVQLVIHEAQQNVDRIITSRLHTTFLQCVAQYKQLKIKTLTRTVGSKEDTDVVESNTREKITEEGQGQDVLRQFQQCKATIVPLINDSTRSVGTLIPHLETVTQCLETMQASKALDLYWVVVLNGVWCLVRACTAVIKDVIAIIQAVHECEKVATEYQEIQSMIRILMAWFRLLHDHPCTSHASKTLAAQIHDGFPPDRTSCPCWDLLNFN